MIRFWLNDRVLKAIKLKLNVKPIRQLQLALCFVAWSEGVYPLQNVSEFTEASCLGSTAPRKNFTFYMTTLKYSKLTIRTASPLKNKKELFLSCSLTKKSRAKKGTFFMGKSKNGFLNPKSRLCFFFSFFFLTKIQKRITNPKNPHSEWILHIHDPNVFWERIRK